MNSMTMCILCFQYNNLKIHYVKEETRGDQQRNLYLNCYGDLKVQRKQISLFYLAPSI